jgi:hypothetical protein
MLAVATLTAAAGVAAVVPALTSARIDPNLALRAD